MVFESIDRVAMLGAIAAMMVGMTPMASHAQKKYDQGVSDTEIKIGQTAPYSGPLSSASEISLTQAAYFKMINERGGVNGRKITYISLDDGYSPPKTVEQTRRLVEQEEVFLIFDQFGTPTSTAAQKYLNGRKVPQLFAGTGSSRFNDPEKYPWSSAILPNYFSEGAIFGKYVSTNLKTAKVAILYQNDDFGKDYANGFKEAVAKNSSIEIVKELSYEPSDPTIDSQIATLAASGATVFLNVSTGKAAPQSIRAVSNLGWKPIHLLNGPWADIGSVFKPAGLEKAVGIITTQYCKTPDEPRWANDEGMKEYLAFMKEYRSSADSTSRRNVQGYLYAQLLVKILQEAGDNLTRENVNRIALHLKDLEFGVLLPSVTITTTPTQRNLIENQLLMRFDGERFVPLETDISSTK